MPSVTPWRQYRIDPSNEKADGSIHLPLDAHFPQESDTHQIWLKQPRTRTSILSTGLKFFFALLASVSLLKLAWFTPSLIVPHQPSLASLTNQPQDDGPGLERWGFAAYGARNSSMCDREIGSHEGFIPTECSPLGEYIQIQGVNWENSGEFQLCLFDSPGCDGDLKASYDKGGKCLDANSAVTYRVVIAGTDCLRHSWKA